MLVEGRSSTSHGLVHDPSRRLPTTRDDRWTSEGLDPAGSYNGVVAVGPGPDEFVAGRAAPS